MLPYAPRTPARPISPDPPGLLSSVSSCVITPVGEAITLTLQPDVLAVPEPFRIVISVTDESCQRYEVWPLFNLNILVGGPHWSTSVSAFFPIYSCPSRVRTAGADAAQPPSAPHSATTPTIRITSPSPHYHPSATGERFQL